MTDKSDDHRSLDDLDARLRAAQAREEIETGRAQERERRVDNTGMGLGFRIAIELVVNIAVGAGLGYFLDKWLGTKPWLMVVFVFLGAAAGVVNVYRVAKGFDDSVGLGRAMRHGSDGQTDDP
ncbi:ATP synthase protein I [mine drainage metagenome]|uniref:ATP synthase protein I n=1 Tax=mine drainage metagenome TaxID=410659 RepID=A0A1J5RQQ8_9ZZZZ